MRPTHSAPRSRTDRRDAARHRPAFLLVAALLALQACASRPGPTALATVDGVPADAQVLDLYAMTTRQRQAPRMNAFTTERADEPSFSRFSVAVPVASDGMPVPSSERGDPKVVGQSVLQDEGFVEAVARAAAESGTVGVFVHGFNFNYPEAIFQATRLSVAAAEGDIAVSFSWPSQATVAGYTADRDAAAFSREALAGLLYRLASDPRIRRINVLGHSMGAWLTMEAMRDLRLSGRVTTLEHLRVFLAAPDIDVDLFRNQLQTIGTFATPLAVLVSPDDLALAASARLTGGRMRLGQVDVTQAEWRELATTYNIAFVDIAEAGSPDELNHRGYAAFARQVGQLSRDERRDAGLVERAGSFMLGTSQ